MSSSRHTDHKNLIENSFFDLRTKRGQISFIFVTILIALLVPQLPVQKIRDFLAVEYTPKCEVISCPENEPSAKPTYWIYGSGGEGQWIHVKNVLHRLGFERVSQQESATADLLWSHDYPFTKLRSTIINSQPHQKINHFPGCGFLTNKVDLATTKLKYIPAAFKLPQQKDEFKEYSGKHPEKSFVVKHHQHRHIKIQKIDDINLTDNLTFIQEYIDNPLLVDGHKFDVGVYTVITSIDPLRVYIYYGDILFRYCPREYNPFDPNDVDKYIVGDDYLPTWEVPSLGKFYNTFGYGMKASFDAYMRNQGKDPQIIWDQVEDAIRTAILSKEPLMKDLMRRYKNHRNFFEMARFDLIVDADLKVYLMEANMSPNLSSAHFKQNFILYEQVIYHVLNLVGVGHYLERESFEKLEHESEIMLSTEKNIMVNGDVCGSPPCSESCAPEECQLCKSCLNYADIESLHIAYREHVNRGDMKRIFPQRIEKSDELDKDYFKSLSAKNQMMFRWFHAKCREDSNWC